MKLEVKRSPLSSCSEDYDKKYLYRMKSTKDLTQFHLEREFYFFPDFRASYLRNKVMQDSIMVNELFNRKLEVNYLKIINLTRSTLRTFDNQFWKNLSENLDLFLEPIKPERKENPKKLLKFLTKLSEELGCFEDKKEASPNIAEDESETSSYADDDSFVLNSRDPLALLDDPVNALHDEVDRAFSKNSYMYYKTLKCNVFNQVAKYYDVVVDGLLNSEYKENYIDIAKLMIFIDQISTIKFPHVDISKLKMMLYGESEGVFGRYRYDPRGDLPPFLKNESVNILTHYIQKSNNYDWDNCEWDTFDYIPRSSDPWLNVDEENLIESQTNEVSEDGILQPESATSNDYMD
eukprot:NODE_717_length_4502_cov_0.079718.p2 type:complete len:349 gc:universal NODE_717_length_4502_cov_0.079718:3325-2279(-)